MYVLMTDKAATEYQLNILQKVGGHLVPCQSSPTLFFRAVSQEYSV